MRPLLCALLLAACAPERPSEPAAPADPRPTPARPVSAATPSSLPTPSPLPKPSSLPTPSPGPAPSPGPTLIPLALQPIGFAEAERADLLGAGCTWAERDGGATLFLALPDRGAIKVGGRIVRFEADAASADLGLGARSRYTGEGIGAVLKPSGPARRTGEETTARPATLSIGADGIDDTPRPGVLTCGS